ncbi:hypothetical protein JC221_222 [Yersinia phage JC221]|nr:hypothetical protein JC221_222 [Yersinia phage JC221]
MKPIFTKADPLGAGSELNANYWNYDLKKNQQFMKDYPSGTKAHRWGSDQDIKKAKILPRGKAYERLWQVCAKREFETQACI